MSNRRRSKKQHGQRAKSTQPIVKHYKVEDTSKWQRWLQDNKQTVAIRGFQIGAALLVGGLVWLVVTLLF